MTKITNPKTASEWAQFKREESAKTTAKNSRLTWAFGLFSPVALIASAYSDVYPFYLWVTLIAFVGYVLYTTCSE